MNTVRTSLKLSELESKLYREIYQLMSHEVNQRYASITAYSDEGSIYDVSGISDIQDQMVATGLKKNDLAILTTMAKRYALLRMMTKAVKRKGACELRGVPDEIQSISERINAIGEVAIDHGLDPFLMHADSINSIAKKRQCVEPSFVESVIALSFREENENLRKEIGELATNLIEKGVNYSDIERIMPIEALILKSKAKNLGLSL